MQTKFNIGQEVFFMKYDKPGKGIIESVTIRYGIVGDTYPKKTFNKENPEIKYKIDFHEVLEDDLFLSKKELINFIDSLID